MSRGLVMFSAGLGMVVVVGCGADNGTDDRGIEVDGGAELEVREVDGEPETGSEPDVAEPETRSEPDVVELGTDAGDDDSRMAESDVAADASEGNETRADVGPSWRDALPSGTTIVAFGMPCQEVVCNPTCLPPRAYAAGFALTLTVPDAGRVSISYVPPAFPSAPPASAEVGDDGTFVVSVQIPQTAEPSGVLAAIYTYTVAGHIGVGRTMTVDSYTWVMLQTAGFADGWTTTVSSIEAQTTTF